MLTVKSLSEWESVQGTLCNKRLFLSPDRYICSGEAPFWYPRKDEHVYTLHSATVNISLYSSEVDKVFGTPPITSLYRGKTLAKFLTVASSRTNRKLTPRTENATRVKHPGTVLNSSTVL